MSSQRWLGVRLHEVLEASIETIAFTPSEMVSHGRVSAYVVTGSQASQSVVGQGQRQGTSWKATAAIQASSNVSTERGTKMGFVCSNKLGRWAVSGSCHYCQQAEEGLQKGWTNR